MMGVVTKTATLLERDSTDVVGRIAEAEIDLLSIDPIAHFINSRGRAPFAPSILSILSLSCSLGIRSLRYLHSFPSKLGNSVNVCCATSC